MADERLEIEIVLEDGSVVKGFQRIQDQAEKTGKQSAKAFETSFSGIGSAFRAVGLAAGAAFAAAGLAVGKIIKDGIAEARGAEDALNSLQAAFRAQGIPVQEASARFQEYASSLQNITTVSDDAIIASADVLVSIGKLRGEGLEQATKAALDLSAGLGKDLSTSFDLVAKAASGNTDALSRYGIRVNENIPKSERFAAVLAQINGAFGGAAEAKVNTYSGALAQLTNRYNDVLENIGKMITESPVVVALIKALADQFLKMGNAVGKLQSSGDVFGDLIKKGLEFGQSIIKYVIAPIELFYNTFKLVVQAVSWGIQGIIVLFAAVGNAIAKAVIYPLQGMIKIMADLASFVSKDMSKALNGFAADMQKIPDTTQAALEVTGAAWVDIGAQVKESTANMFNFDSSAAASNFVTKLQETAEAAKPPAKETGRGVGQALIDGMGESMLQVDSVSEAFRLGLTEVAITAVDIAKTVQNALVSGFSNSFAALGRGLAAGGNGMKDFGKQVLGTLGALAIQMGQFFLLVGAGMSSTGALFGLSGAGAIAAGVGLTVLGGFLQGMAGEGGGGGGVASSSTSASAGGGTVSPEIITQPDIQDRQPQTQVQVNVQGNVLDRRESGLAIVDVLNEYFSANDGRLVSVS